jgi:eukaryotic-like serine/threonine-protein kinase
VPLKATIEDAGSVIVDFLNPTLSLASRVGMAAPSFGETLLRPGEPLDRQPEPAGDVEVRSLAAWRRRSATGWAQTPFPTDVINEAVTRLRALGLLYAFTFLMADFVPELLFRPGALFANPIKWVPGSISIAAALAVVIVLRRARLEYRVVTIVSLVFEIVGSYGIAAAEFLQPSGLNISPPWIGLSWVAVWTLTFNVVVPTPPRYAVLAALAAVSSVPVMVGLSLSLFPPPVSRDGVTMFVAFVLPYILVVIMAYVGARVVYSLGTKVSHARELGSYRLVARLGQGGMGEVWKASHRLLARPAAIKLIRAAPSGISDDARRRFEREAQVIAGLRSPHTVTLFDFGVADDGAFYYVMELLDGLDAEALVRRFGPMPAERVIYVLRQMCHSMSEAHACGLVHRDIKPANVFLCRYGEDHDFVKVLDFGIARAGSHQTRDTETALTVGNMIQGTPAFIAPEQALGDLDVDMRADIYSAGCVAYWLLTGHLVFTADTPIKLVLAHAHAAPEPPSARSALPVPADLDAVVLSCLAKDRERRPRSSRELLERLDTVLLRQSWTETRAREWWEMHLPSAAQ